MPGVFAQTGALFPVFPPSAQHSVPRPSLYTHEQPTPSYYAAVFYSRSVCRGARYIMPPQKRTPIDIWRKQEVIRWIDNEGGGVPTRAVKHFRSLGWSIDGGAVRKWWRARDEILAADPKTRRLPGAGRKKTSLPGGGGGGGSGASTTSSVDHEYESRSAAALGGGEADAPAPSTGAFQLSLPMETDESMPATVGDNSPRPTDSQPPLQQQQTQQKAATTDAPLTPTIAPLTPSERAVQLLQRRYSGKLTDEDVVEAFDVMLDPMKARIFLIMTPGEQRDLWLLRQIEKRRGSAGSSPTAAATGSGDRVV